MHRIQLDTMLPVPLHYSVGTFSINEYSMRVTLDCLLYTENRRMSAYQLNTAMPEAFEAYSNTLRDLCNITLGGWFNV